MSHFASTVTSLLGDLGLERSPTAERGLAVWAVVIGIFALATLSMALRRMNAKRLDSESASSRGWPFMRRTLAGVAQLGGGVLAVYSLAWVTQPHRRMPEGCFLVQPPPHEVTVLERQGDVIWAGGKEGLFAVDRRSMAAIKTSLGSHDLRGVRALLAENGLLWIGCKKGIYRFDGKIVEALAPPGRADFAPVTAVCRTRDGALWIGAGREAWRLIGSAWERFAVAEGLDLPSVDVIYQDRSGIVWFGSQEPEARGLWRYNGAQWGLFDGRSGLPSNAVNAFIEDDAGRLWVATGFGTIGGAVFFENGHWNSVDAACPLRGKSRSLFTDSHRRFWICSENEGAAVRSGGAWKHFTLEDGLPGMEVKNMIEDQDHWLWLASERGLGCIRIGKD